MLQKIDNHIGLLIWTSIVLLFVELSTGSSNSLDGNMWIFLWVERLTAVIFMIEYILRIRESENKTGYVTSPLGIVDLLAFAPFMIGFFVPVSWLGWVRSLRILRLLKRFRYDRRLQLFLLALYRAWWLIRTIMSVAVFISLFAAVLLYGAEAKAQPESFGNIWSVLFWYIPVTGTTVGYGDMFPVTPIGRACSIIFLLIPLIGLSGSLLGVIGSQFQEIAEMERDPDIDPIEEFRKERQRRVDLG